MCLNVRKRVRISGMFAVADHHGGQSVRRDEQASIFGHHANPHHSQSQGLSLKLRIQGS